MEYHENRKGIIQIYNTKKIVEPIELKIEVEKIIAKVLDSMKMV